MAAPFSPETREAALAALPSADLDLLVIGGGITGAAVARDAALRGLAVALVERIDWAAGTSSRSSKLIHGGVRYLQQGDVSLVREAAAERAVLRRIAPHLALPCRMLMPTRSRAAQAKLGLGLWTFERIAGIPADERYERWSASETLRREPTLDGTQLHGAVTFTEYLTDDARLVLDTVRGAHAAGALCANHAEVTAVEGCEVTLQDAFGGPVRRVRSRAVVNAAGPWVDVVRARARALSGARLHLTKGILTYLGTTDTDYGAPTAYPEVTSEDAAYLFEAAERTFAAPALTSADVVATWAGLRPLLHEEGKGPSEISRRDEIMEAENGLVSIAGGKLTTHRRMAERVVDLVCRRLGVTRPCRTDTVALPNGEEGPEALRRLAQEVAERLPQLRPGGAERLIALHGTGCRRLLARIAARPEAGAPLPGPSGVLGAEIEEAIDEEMALTLEDVLDRRTRLLLFDARQGLETLEAVATLAAARLGWDRTRTAAEIDGYRHLAASLRSFA
ncbi:MAG: glycerol-3-phosphate dehydrogenase/oxidase [Deltaproteobacteria bacterium]|nr:MAG: glycerol-3-phosphate dehydrogenase/oxidase [Deltaproteobacteria bacterium]